ncbi:MAG: CaiB/BaiF CoA-transferase family protein [Thermodesulfobacteriota bacterium]
MGPLKGVRVIEVGGIGPGPFCAMMLSDMGADIIRVERRGEPLLFEPKHNVLHRGRPSIGVDLKKSAGIELLLRLVEKADALQEGYRPGVMEKLGLGPEVCLKRNPRLVYGRMTGWGQEGPLSQAAGHDINYIALTGALYSIGRPDQNPVPPLNLVGDFGGGGMLLAFGMACALFETQRSGQGQVIDAAMVDGSAALMAMFYGQRSSGLWTDERASNFLDTGAHYYDTYETSDGKWISIGSIEPQFYALLLKYLDISDPEFQVQQDRTRWPALKKKIAAIFKTKTREQWSDILLGTDVCFGPVLSMGEALEHPHNVARKTFVTIEGVPQPAPAPRFSRTEPEIQGPSRVGEQDAENALLNWGISKSEIERLKASEVI